MPSEKLYDTLAIPQGKNDSSGHFSALTKEDLTLKVIFYGCVEKHIDARIALVFI